MSSVLTRTVGAGKKRANVAFVPAVPMVNLLPAEYGERRKVAALKRRLLFAVVAVVALAVVAYAAALATLTSARDEQARAEQETTRLLQAQQEYAEVPRVLGQLQRATDARALGMSTEILWSPYLGAIGAVMPEGVTLTSVTLTGATPSVGAPLPTSPLVRPSVATLSFEAEGAQLVDTAAWVDQLNAVPGLQDAWVSTTGVTDSEGETVYTFTSKVGIAESAFARRFAPEGN